MLHCGPCCLSLPAITQWSLPTPCPSLWSAGLPGLYCPERMELKAESTHQAQPSCPLSGRTRARGYLQPLSAEHCPFIAARGTLGTPVRPLPLGGTAIYAGHRGNLQGGGRAEPQPSGSWLLAASSTQTSRSLGSWLPTVLNCHRAPVPTLGSARTITEPRCWKLVVPGLPQSPRSRLLVVPDVALKGKECFPQGWSGQEACCCTLGHASPLAGDFTLPWPHSV